LPARLSYLQPAAKRSARTLLGVGARKDQVGGLFRDHGDRRVGVARGDLGHDRSISDADTLNAMDPEIRSHDRIVVIAHATGRDREKDGGGDVTGGPGEPLLSLDVAARQMLLWRKAPEGGGCHEPAGMADRLNGNPPIHLGAEVVWPDLGCDCRIGTRNVAAPPTFRTQI